ncbi:JAB domain-containing protein [Pedobacter panaciterrae]
MMKAQNLNPLFLVSEISVSYQPKFKASERPRVTSSQEAYKVLINNWDMQKIHFQEQFYVLMLNSDGRVIGIALISTGGKAATIADPKIIFSIALKAQATSIILAHNHPSENLKPSHADLNLTRRMVEAGKFLDLMVVDHLIVTSEGFYSFGDEGLI